jgi:hypothetical protein
MSSEPEIPLYDPHMQRLLAYLDECGLGIADIASGGPGVRDEAERFIASFVRFDEPDQPERFRAVASRLIEVMQRFAAENPDTGEADEMEHYHLLKRRLSDFLVVELGPPKGHFFE